MYAHPMLRVLTATAVLVLAQACGSSKYMTKVDRLPLKPTSSQSVLVFMRPSSLGSAVTFTLLDSEGHYFGDALSEGYHSVVVKPGPIAVFASAENDAAVKGTLEGGRVYYVVVEPVFGVFSARVGLVPIKPGSERWSRKDQWLKESTPYRVDLKGGQAALDPKDVKKNLKNGEATWQKYDAEQKKDRTILPEDGVLVTPAVPVVAPAAPSTSTTAAPQS